MAKKIDKKIKEILKKMVDADIIKDLKQKNLSILFEVSQSVISELLIEIKSEYISNKIKNNLSKAKESNDSYIIFVWDKLLKVMNQNLSANERSSTDIDAENLYNNLLLQTLGNDIIVYRNVFDIIVRHLDIYQKDYDKSCENLVDYLYGIIEKGSIDKDTAVYDKAKIVLKKIHKAYKNKNNEGVDILCKIILESDSIEIPNDNDIAVSLLKIYPNRYMYLDIDLPNIITFIAYNTLLHFIFKEQYIKK